MLVLVQEHVQLCAVIVVRNGRRAVRRRQQRMAGAAHAGLMAVRQPPFGRYRVQYRRLGRDGRTSGSTPSGGWRSGQSAFSGRRRW